MDYVITSRDIVTTVYTLRIDEEYIESLRKEWVRQQGTDSSFITLELVYAAIQDRKALDILTQMCPESGYETIGDWIRDIIQEDAWDSRSEEVDVDGYDTQVDIEFSDEDQNAKLEERLEDWLREKQNEVPENQLSFFDT